MNASTIRFERLNEHRLKIKPPRFLVYFKLLFQLFSDKKPLEILRTTLSYFQIRLF